ncbi:MAG TPA: phosphotransferase [Naasia sp.]
MTDLLVTEDDVRAYLDSIGLLGSIGGRSGAVTVREVTAGNMNRVFLAHGQDAPAPGRGIAVKQAPPWVQAAGPSWPIDPARIGAEARAYERLSVVAPEVVPRIMHADLDRWVLVMEDLSDLAVLRDALVAQVAAVVEGRAPAQLDVRSTSIAVGRFVGALTAATAGLSGAERDRLIEESANPELCALTVDVVLTEPYGPHEHNSWHPHLDPRVRALHADSEVGAAVAVARQRFDAAQEALLHGDLHTGSVMVGVRGGAWTTKVFDPEFSFVGPVGMDLGLYWANLAIAATAAEAVGATELAAEREAGIAASWKAFTAELATAERLPLDLDRIRDDAWRFAAVEAIRRVAGYSHAADLERLPRHLVGPASAAVFDRARAWLLTARDPGPDLPRLES